MSLKPFRCQESAVYQSDLDVDAENGVIRNVKVLGFESPSNRRRYARRGVEAAIAKYDGVKVNLNHDYRKGMAPAPRRFEDRFGRLHGPELRDDGLYARELRVNPEHPFAKAFLWFAKNDPAAIGLSHDAILRGPEAADGWREIEEIPHVFSVDIVADPGSTKGLFESVEPDNLTPETPAPEAPSLDAAIASVIAAIMADESLDKAAKRAKLLTALKLSDDEEAPEPEAPSDSGTQESKTLATEVAKLRKELDTFRAKETARADRAAAKAASLKAGIPEKFISDVFLDDLVISARESWDAKIADRRAIVVSGKPKSGGSGAGGPAANVDDFVSSVWKGN